MSPPSPRETEQKTPEPMPWLRAVALGVLAVLTVLDGQRTERLGDDAFLALMAALSVATLCLLARCLGWRDAALFVAVTMAAAFGFEMVAIHLFGWLTYQVHPQVAGLPPAILGGWLIGVAPSYALAAVLAKDAGVLCRAALTGGLAVLFDLTADPVGLAQGIWIWHEPGGYASSVVGENRLAGIPWFNFLGWVMAAFLAVVVFEHFARGRRNFHLTWSAGLYFIFCLPGLAWAIRNQRWELFAVPALPLTLLAVWVVGRIGNPACKSKKRLDKGGKVV